MQFLAGSFNVPRASDMTPGPPARRLSRAEIQRLYPGVEVTAPEVGEVLPMAGPSKPVMGPRGAAWRVLINQQHASFRRRKKKLASQTKGGA